MRKIAIFSDIHGNLQALNSILADIEKENVDDIYFLGDMIGFGPCPKECVDTFMKTKIKAVKGNHEVYQVDDNIKNSLLSDKEKKHRDWVRSELNEEELDYIRSLPMYREELLYGHLFTFCHFFLNQNKDYFEGLDILNDDRVYEIANKIETDYLFIGHCHDDFQVHCERFITCGGSSGCTPNQFTFYLIVEIEGNNVKVIRKELSYDRKAFERDLLKKNYPERNSVAETFFGVRING